MQFNLWKKLKSNIKQCKNKILKIFDLNFEYWKSVNSVWIQYKHVEEDTLRFTVGDEVGAEACQWHVPHESPTLFLSHFMYIIL